MATTLKITIPSDARGFVGRQCPTCGRYFKVMPGTGTHGPAPCYCAYCGHRGNPNQFFTEEQIQYARSAARRYAHNKISKMLKRHEGPIGRQDGFIKMSIKVTQGSPPSLFQYCERELESELICSHCTLRYTIFGVFAYCPDCGLHNSEQILNKNLDVVEKMLAIADQQEAELAQQIIEDALENAVSSFDGFGRACVGVLNSRLNRVAGAYSFQNLEKARGRLRCEFNIDIACATSAERWKAVFRSFQKRHLLAHCMGIIDDTYISATQDSDAVRGRKVRIAKEEVLLLIGALREIAHLMAEAEHPESFER